MSKLLGKKAKLILRNQKAVDVLVFNKDSVDKYFNRTMSSENTWGSKKNVIDADELFGELVEENLFEDNHDSDDDYDFYKELRKKQAKDQAKRRRAQEEERQWRENEDFIDDMIYMCGYDHE